MDLKSTLTLTITALLMSGAVAVSTASASTHNSSTLMKSGSGMDGRSTSARPARTGTRHAAQDNRGPDRTGPLGGTHNGS